jgi:hypothetical protein
VSIKRLLDSAVWTALPAPAETGELPYATHEGILTFAGAELRCYQLSTGERVFTPESLELFYLAMADIYAQPQCAGDEGYEIL